MFCSETAPILPQIFNLLSGQRKRYITPISVFFFLPGRRARAVARVCCRSCNRAGYARSRALVVPLFLMSCRMTSGACLWTGCPPRLHEGACRLMLLMRAGVLHGSPVCLGPVPFLPILLYFLLFFLSPSILVNRTLSLVPPSSLGCRARKTFMYDIDLSRRHI